MTPQEFPGTPVGTEPPWASSGAPLLCTDVNNLHCEHLQQRWFVGSPARPGLFSGKDSGRIFSGMFNGTTKQENAQAIHPLVHLLSLYRVLCFHAPVQVLLKSGRPGPPAGPPFSPRLLPCSSGRQHRVPRGAHSHGQLLHPKAIRVRRMPVSLESQHVFIFLRVMLLSPRYFCSGYYLFLWQDSV